MVRPQLPIGDTWDMPASLLHALNNLAAACGSKIFSVRQFIPFALPANPAWRRSEVARLGQLKVELHARLVCELLEATETSVVSTHQSAAKFLEVFVCSSG
ncbi:hypothetical protein D9M71_754860 [compost metagenome]